MVKNMAEGKGNMHGFIHSIKWVLVLTVAQKGMKYTYTFVNFG